MARTARVVIDPLIEGVATASAAYLWDVWPEIVKAPPEEAFRRLALHFETAIRAYFEALENWGFPPRNENTDALASTTTTTVRE